MNDTKTKQFKSESKRLLELMINSIYTHKEIFLRELISNSSDAIDKLYYRSLNDNITGLLRSDFAISIKADKENRTITISDNGIGMTEDELENNLGTIAKSGSLAFKNENENKEDIDIIGQFGIGFYSAFMIADEITVLSKAHGAQSGFKWHSAGANGYTIEPYDKEVHGSEIILKLKANTEDENYDQYLDSYKIEQLIKKYSDYIRYPIKMDVVKSRKKEDSEEYEEYTENKTLNSMVPIWKKNKNETTEEDYNNFYKEKFFDFMPPAKVIHSSTEGSATYNALLFIPSRPPFNYYTREYEKGLQLYASGVLIMESCKDLLPDYFSFVKGLVDSQDLSLNISREMLQHDRQLKIIASRIEKKIKSELKSMLENNRDEYVSLYKNFGLQLKYGIYSDYGTHKDLLQDLIMFHSSNENTLVTLAEYRSRMSEEQKYIYYACGESIEKIAALPQTELVKEKGYEIFYLTDDVDEFAIKMLGTFEEKEFRCVSAGDLGLETEDEKKENDKKSEENKDMLAHMTNLLLGKVKSVRPSNRLKSHPVCLASEGEISLEMEKVLNAMPTNEKVKADRVLEINANHPIFNTLCKLYTDDKEKLDLYTDLLYTQALLIEGITIDNPVEFSNGICQLMK